jgi:PAS domain S-box-containing protein
MTDHSVSDSHLLFSLYEEGPEAFEQLPSGVLTVFLERGFNFKWDSRFAAIWKLPQVQATSRNTITFGDLESHCSEQTVDVPHFQLIPSYLPLADSGDIFRDSVYLEDGRILHRTLGVADRSDPVTLHCVYEEYSPAQADLLRLQEWNDTFDAFPDHISLLDLSGAIVRANRTMRERFEPVHGALEGLDYRLLYCGTATPDPQPPCAQVLSGGPAVEIETELPTMDGMYRVAATPVHDSQGRQWGAISIVADITDEHQLRLASSEQQQLIQELVRSSMDGIICGDEYGTVSLWNREAENILGWTADEAIGRRLDQLIVPAAAVDQLMNGLARFRREKTGPLIGQRTEVQGRHKGGHLVDVEMSLSAVEVNGRTSACGFVHDITDRIQAQKELESHRDHLQELVDDKTEKLQQTVRQLKGEIRIRETALRSSEQRLSSVVNSISESILLLSEHGQVLLANQPPPYSLLTDVVGRKFQEFWPPEPARELADALAATDSQATQRGVPVSFPNAGADACVEVSIIPIAGADANREIVLVLRDITAERAQQRERERADTTQAHLSRLHALGEMASNIAHEINQPLTSVTNLASAVRRALRKLENLPPAIEEILGEIINESQRAGNIVHGLNDFARRRPVMRKTINLRECVASTLTLTSNELGVYQTGVTATVPDDICIYADDIHIQQILVNLILNAVQAIDAAGSRHRHIWIEGLVSGLTVKLTVRDSGPGFGETLDSNPLEAFVTTKPQGTGLGLSICRSLTEINEGALTIEDAPEGGAVVTIQLPAATLKTAP